MFTEKMYKALRRDHEGKNDTVSQLLDEIDRLNKELHPVCHCAKCDPNGVDAYYQETEEWNEIEDSQNKNLLGC